MAAPTIVDSTSASSTTATALTINRPAATPQVGDVYVAWVCAQSNATVVRPKPTGWSEFSPAYNTSGDANRRPSGWTYLVMDSSGTIAGLPSSWSWGTVSSGRMTGSVYLVRGADVATIASWPVSSAYMTPSNSATATRALLGATTTVADTLTLWGVYGQMNNTGATNPKTVSWPGGMTEMHDFSNQTTGTVTASVHGVASEVIVTPAATGTRTATFSETPANATGLMVAIPPATTPTPTATNVRVISHRGTLDSAADSTENSIAGLDILATLRRPVSGIEWDVRVSSDGELFMMHDTTGARTHPAMGATGVEGYTASQLDGFGVTRLTAGLAAIPGRGIERVNVQHYFPGSSTAAMTKLVQQINASPVASRVKIMTSISGPYAPAAIRAAGWTGPIGTYGSTAANYAGSGDGKAADFPASNIGWAYLPPGGYTANRSHAQALVAGGTIKVGASTENSSTQWAEAHADGIDEMLTDNADSWLALYEPPYFLEVADAAHAHAADAVTLTQAHTLVAADAAHAHTAQAPALTQVHGLTVADTTHVHAVQGVTLTQVHALAAQDAAHAHAAEQASISTGATLGVQDTTHPHSAQSPTLTQQHFLVASGALHGHSADVVSLVPMLTAQDATHGHTAQALTLSQQHALEVAGSTHPHTVDSVDLPVTTILTVDDVLHSHYADMVTVLVGDAVKVHLTVTPRLRSFTTTARTRHTVEADL